MRRCSFSSSVFARFLKGLLALHGLTIACQYFDAYRGGRLVLGVGSSWPQDFRFFVGLLSS